MTMSFTLLLSCDGDSVTIDLTATLNCGDQQPPMRFRTQRMGQTIECAGCAQVHELFPIVPLSLNCDNQFAVAEVSFGRLDACCTNCADQVQMTIEGVGAGLICDNDTCQSVEGTYVLHKTNRIASPACFDCTFPGFGEGLQGEWCVYEYVFDPPLMCDPESGRQITELRVLFGILNCSLQIFGEIIQFETSVACFTHDNPILDIFGPGGFAHDACNDPALGEILTWCANQGPPLCNWEETILTIQRVPLILTSRGGLGPLGLPMGRLRNRV
jgi:hypothetical protein